MNEGLVDVKAGLFNKSRFSRHMIDISWGGFVAGELFLFLRTPNPVARTKGYAEQWHESHLTYAMKLNVLMDETLETI